MKDILIRLLIAAALTLAAVALSSSAHGQQADEDMTPIAPPGNASQSPGPVQSQSPQSPSSPSSAGDEQTQQALAFTGRIEREKGTLVLKDPTTKMTYQLDDQSKATKFIGKQVKVTGKLQMKTDTIRVESIELFP